MFQILNDNKVTGLMFKTEGNTLAQTFESEHGNYSNGFRKTFHHKTISCNHRKDHEYVEPETPKQVSSLIPNAENGLFSRFVFYYMNILPNWKNVFAGNNSCNGVAFSLFRSSNPQQPVLFFPVADIVVNCFQKSLSLHSRTVSDSQMMAW